jgi:2-polyprenyl-6-hydroxyphenyl methylase/3-demethylubiquinone-9 3-methyltransferase
MSGDRIAELYLGTSGDAFSPSARTDATERIDWMVANAVGQSVLDAGCSQGIATLLLARAGRRALGVEPDDESINYARELLLSEPADVRDRASFVVATAEDLVSKGELYDSIVCGEVIEHLEDPAGFLEAAWALLLSRPRVPMLRHT